MHINRNLLHLKWRIYQEERFAWMNQKKEREEYPSRLGLDHCDFDCLLMKLNNPHPEIRLAAAKALGRMNHPGVGQALVSLLQDVNLSVRWAAIENLSHLRREAIRPLLSALTHNYDSPSLRLSAHHVLENLHASGHLTDGELAVLQMLRNHPSALDIAKKANEALLNGS